MHITKRQLREALNLESNAALAAFFEITEQAVCQWPENEPVPELRALQAVNRKPELRMTFAEQRAA